MSCNGSLAAQVSHQFTVPSVLGGSPTVSDLKPDHGPVSGGTRVTISGQNFVARCHGVVWLHTGDRGDGQREHGHQRRRARRFAGERERDRARHRGGQRAHNEGSLYLRAAEDRLVHAPLGDYR